MSKKVVVDRNYQPVDADSPEAAFVFNADDPKLAMYQAKAGKPAKPAPKAAPVTDDNDGSVERVQRPTAKK